MSIRISSFMGKFGWAARQYFPNLASAAYLKLQFATRGKTSDQYIEYFLRQEEVPMPQIVNIETVNRCNSTCAFCTANIHAEKRPFCRMTDELYHSIIDQLHDWGYKGHLTLYGNNEPLLDPRIVELHKYAREKLPESFIFMSTNGLILTLDKVREVQPYIDQLIINNYSNEMKLHDNLQEIYDYVKAHPQEFEDIEIVIQMRYLQEVLTNRAGSAPNKQEKKPKEMKQTCLLPFTDMWITPDGRMGLCCCDNLEKTTYADLTKTPLKEAWAGQPITEVRKLLAKGRNQYPFCKYCDFIDAGFRTQVCKHILAGDQDAANRTGGEEKNDRQSKK